MGVREMMLVFTVMIGAYMVLCTVLGVRKDSRGRAEAIRSEVRQAAKVEQYGINARIRDGEATLDDVARSFFLDDVVSRPEAYEVDIYGRFTRRG